MPAYEYSCKFCNEHTTIVHDVGNTVTRCPECAREELSRVYSFSLSRGADSKQRPGVIVDSFIEEAKKEIKEEKKRLKKKEYTE